MEENCSKHMAFWRNKGLFRREKMIQFLVHLVGLSIIIVIPELLLMQYFPEPLSAGDKPVVSVLVKSLCFAAVFYVNFFWLFDWTYAKRNRMWLFFGINVGMIVVASWFITIGFNLPAESPAPDLMARPEVMLGGPPPEGPPPEGPPPSHKHHGLISPFVIRDFVAMMLVVGLAVAVKLAQKSLAVRQRIQKLQNAQQAIELDSLKSQLNPHFLFNTLNTIYVLVDIDSSKAKNAIYELSKMLRHMLYAKGSVTLKQEVEWVENYIALMRLRLPPNARLTTQLNVAEAGSVMIAPLLFVTLIENLFKHGDLTREGEAATVSLGLNDDTLVFVTSNFKLPDTDSKQAGGIGLTNLRKRLAMLYGNRASIKVENGAERFTVTMTITLDPIALTENHQ